MKWQYMGREKFRELLQELKNVQESAKVWLYGTQGYGKSHLLAALVCYLAAQDEQVVYIPDCRACLMDPVEYIRPAMLFAWADDIATQREVMALKTEKEIEDFIKSQKKVIFVIDQMNALKDKQRLEATERPTLSDWLMRFTSTSKAVFSSSANYTEYLEHSIKQSSDSVLHANGGLTRVSHLKIYVTMRASKLD